MISSFDIWFYNNAVPYVSAKIKDVSLFIPFVNSLTFCVPRKQKTSEWYLVVDDGEMEFFCNYSKIYKYRVTYVYHSKNVEINFSVSEKEADAILKSVKDMVENSPEQFMDEVKLTTYKPKRLIEPVEIIAKRWFKKNQLTRGYPEQVWNV